MRLSTLFRKFLKNFLKLPKMVEGCGRLRKACKNLRKVVENLRKLVEVTKVVKSCGSWLDIVFGRYFSCGRSDSIVSFWWLRVMERLW